VTEDRRQKTEDRKQKTELKRELLVIGLNKVSGVGFQVSASEGQNYKKSEGGMWKAEY
jgi:hypothetical protein